MIKRTARETIEVIENGEIVSKTTRNIEEIDDSAYQSLFPFHYRDVLNPFKELDWNIPKPTCKEDEVAKYGSSTGDKVHIKPETTSKL
jgi:hypothetical protein